MRFAYIISALIITLLIFSGLILYDAAYPTDRYVVIAKKYVPIHSIIVQDTIKHMTFIRIYPSKYLLKISNSKGTCVYNVTQKTFENININDDFTKDDD